MEVGGYLTRWARIAASIALESKPYVNESVRKVGLELLGKLKKCAKLIYCTSEELQFYILSSNPESGGRTGGG